VGTIGFCVLEGWSVTDALYMTVITVSTVGFKEVHPLSPAGKLFAIVVIIGGLGTAGYTFTMIVQLMLEGELLDILGRRRMKSSLDKLDRHLIVCGYGRIGKPVVQGLERDGQSFVVIDKDTSEDEFRRRGHPYIIGDATDEEILRLAHVEKASVLLALLPSDPDNLFLAITAKSINPRIRVISRAQDEKAETKLKRGGADSTVSPYGIAAHRVLHAAVRPAIVEFLEIVTRDGPLQLNMEEVVVAEGSSLSGRSLAESGLRKSFGVIVVGIKKPSGEMVFNPEASEMITSGDILIAMGGEGDLERLEAACTRRK
ncbi:MAG: potassium channel protein, partial [Acidobacteriota bacterium]|nr:potassium channel protein [Acidobacteriota bacterium]